MSARNFNTQNDSYRQLMGNGLTYQVPRFQRDYSWGEDEWDTLWQDILGTVSEGAEPAHYMGYLVLQTKDDKVFDVIDGQQRLITLSILILAILANLERLIREGRNGDDNRIRKEELYRNFIGFRDPETLVPRSKLRLNRNNDSYYQNYIVALRDLPNYRLKSTERLLRESFLFYEKRVWLYTQNLKDDHGKALARFAGDLSDRLFFTKITVDDELNAYKVFETLNARGVRLSPTDLLKNTIFSILHRESRHEHEVNNMEERWEALVGKLGSESFPDFLRVHWNARREFAREAELYRKVRAQVSTSESAFALMRDMEEDVDVYSALSNPEASDLPQELRILASTLRTFKVRQPLAMLLSARRKFPDSGFEAILRAVVVIAFRYNVIGNRGTAEQERIFSSVALAISRGQLHSEARVIAELAPIYVGDSEFRNAFAEKSIRTTDNRNAKVMRYVLAELERHISQARLDFGHSHYNIEHVMPQNPGEGWQHVSEDTIDQFRFRIGNMTLLESSRNREIGNKSFSEKRRVYAESQIVLTRKLAEQEEWGPEQIRNRQEWMAAQATAIWRIPQLPS